ncbi:MAG: hypothetical protein ACYC3R_04970 [Thiomonas delicata]|uniref:hypothetical protein n=1 Tax=Thiomonas delicata TaxID=364030 RepID=UPI00113FFA2A|nr:hypothetical protein [Thiomonas delicata]
MNKPLETTANGGSAKPTTVQPEKSISTSAGSAKFTPMAQAKPEEKTAHQATTKGDAKDQSSQLHAKSGMNTAANKPRAR